MSSLKKFGAGCVAGAIGSLVGNPFDELKVKMMTGEGASLGITATGKDIFAAQGIGGFYKGMHLYACTGATARFTLRSHCVHTAFTLAACAR